MQSSHTHSNPWQCDEGHENSAERANVVVLGKPSEKYVEARNDKIESKRNYSEYPKLRSASPPP